MSLMSVGVCVCFHIMRVGVRSMDEYLEQILACKRHANLGHAIYYGLIR
jgi:hypothetical protein